MDASWDASDTVPLSQLFKRAISHTPMSDSKTSTPTLKQRWSDHRDRAFNRRNQDQQDQLKLKDEEEDHYLEKYPQHVLEAANLKRPLTPPDLRSSSASNTPVESYTEGDHLESSVLKSQRELEQVVEKVMDSLSQTKRYGAEDSASGDGHTQTKRVVFSSDSAGEESSSQHMPSHNLENEDCYPCGPKETPDISSVLRSQILLPLRPKKFSGSTKQRPFRTFLREFETYSFAANYSDEGRKAEFALYLENGPHAYFWSLPKETRETYAKLKKAFIQKYDSVDEQFLLDHELGERRQGVDEPVEVFLDDVMQLCSRLNKTPQEHLSLLYRGLTPKIKEFVLLKRPTTVLALELEAKLAQRILKMREVASPKIAAVGLHESISPLEELTRMVHDIRLDQATTVAALVESTRAKDQRPTCFKCNKIGHFAAQCRQEPFRCYTCQQSGHLSKACPNRNSQYAYRSGRPNYSQRYTPGNRDSNRFNNTQPRRQQYSPRERQNYRSDYSPRPYRRDYSDERQPYNRQIPQRSSQASQANNSRSNSPSSRDQSAERSDFSRRVRFSGNE